MYTNSVFGTAKCVLLSRCPYVRGVLNEGFHCICTGLYGVILNAPQSTDCGV